MNQPLTPRAAEVYLADLLRPFHVLFVKLDERALVITARSVLNTGYGRGPAVYRQLVDLTPEHLVSAGMEVLIDLTRVRPLGCEQST